MKENSFRQFDWRMKVTMEVYVCSWKLVKFIPNTAKNRGSIFTTTTFLFHMKLTSLVRHGYLVQCHCLQDRVAQVYGGLVYMDFDKDKMDKCRHGNYIELDTSLLPLFHLIYAENPSDSGKVHSTVRQRWLDGDKFIISSMEEAANLALDGKQLYLKKIILNLLPL
ncbi:unnamed protein product [Lactuca virosa]|uniref:Uncharacterized protein n=1 Tax=Lactuca virosa TaxID=75947 RepID=A0AAU9LQK0_9ASTR|nr:unnamed protein product [Lactuca virosa]